MPFADTITSVQNPRIKQLVRLREARERRETGCFLIEGRREIARALAKGVELTEFHACEADFPDPAEDTALAADIAARVPLAFHTAKEAFAKASHREGPDGFLAIARMWPLGLERLELSANPLVLVAERLEKPGNVGALLRIADAAGADAVVLADPATDLFNPNVVRAAQGALFSVPTAVADNATLLAWLREHGIAPVATTPASSQVLWDTDLSRPTAILMGSEAWGLSDFWLREHRDAVTPMGLPMSGQTDSLNVSACAAICLFEAVRQRRR